jgi:hypothetical protein
VLEPGGGHSWRAEPAVAPAGDSASVELFAPSPYAWLGSAAARLDALLRVLLVVDAAPPGRAALTRTLTLTRHQLLVAAPLRQPVAARLVAPVRGAPAVGAAAGATAGDGGAGAGLTATAYRGRDLFLLTRIQEDDQKAGGTRANAHAEPVAPSVAFTVAAPLAWAPTDTVAGCLAAVAGGAALPLPWPITHAASAPAEPAPAAPPQRESGCVWVAECTWSAVAGAPLQDAALAAVLTSAGSGASIALNRSVDGGGAALAACRRAAAAVQRISRAAAAAGAVAVVLMERSTGGALSGRPAMASGAGASTSMTGGVLVPPQSDLFLPLTSVAARAAAVGVQATCALTPSLPPVLWASGPTAGALRAAATANAAAAAGRSPATLQLVAMLQSTSAWAARRDGCVEGLRALVAVALPSGAISIAEAPAPVGASRLDGDAALVGRAAPRPAKRARFDELGPAGNGDHARGTDTDVWDAVHQLAAVVSTALESS